MLPNYTVKKYTKEAYSSWNDFIKNSKNGTFLFHREFMEYHADRFQDFSVMIYNDKTLIGLFPANIVDNIIYSHQGLTYGGLLLLDSIGGEKVRNILFAIVNFYKKNQIQTIFIKSIPIFYHTKPAHEFTFFVSDLGGNIYERHLNLAIDYRLPLRIHKSKLKNYEKRKNLGFSIEETLDFSGFWNKVLIPRLAKKHKTLPVHSLEEISLLKNKFPEFIKQYTIRLEGRILAGITIFISNQVVKSQYGAVTNEGEKHRALDFLFISLIKKYKELEFVFFDMGTVTEDNFGLLKQKEELGCEIYTQDFYRVEV